LLPIRRASRWGVGAGRALGQRRLNRAVRGGRAGRVLHRRTRQPRCDTDRRPRALSIATTGGCSTTPSSSPFSISPRKRRAGPSARRASTRRHHSRDWPTARLARHCGGRAGPRLGPRCREFGHAGAGRGRRRRRRAWVHARQPRPRRSRNRRLGAMATAGMASNSVFPRQTSRDPPLARPY